MDNREEYWSIKEFAGYIKAGKSTIYQGIKDGRFPRPIKICGLTRWRRSEIEAFLDAAARQRPSGN